VPSYPLWATTGVIRSQWIFKTSPDGSHLAYLTPASGQLHLRDQGGNERTIEGVKSNDWRFSPDGTRVATILGEGYLRSIVVLDLAHGIARELGKAVIPDRVEWTKQGVVVRELRELDPRGWNHRHRLTYYPLAGPSRTLLERRGIHGYATAADGSRVIFFDVARDGWADVSQISVDGAGNRAPTRLGRLKDVLDAELSLAGRRAAIVTATGMHVVEGGRLRLVSREKNVTTLWFSGDGGRVLFSSPRMVTLLEGTRTRTFKADGQPVESARFLRGGPEVLIATRRSVLRWNPDLDEQHTVATARDGETILAADLLADEVVVLTQKPAAHSP